MKSHPDGRADVHGELGEWREVGPARPLSDALAEAEQDRPRGPARSRPRRGVVGFVFGALGLATFVVGGRELWRAHTLASQCAEVVRTLDATPGLVVLSNIERAGVLHIRGLADPAARPPAEVAASVVPARTLARLTLDFAPFEAPSVEFTEARLRRRLGPPLGVEVHVDDTGIACFSGEAPAAWIERARAVAPGVPGVEAVDLAGLVDIDRREVARLVAALDGHAVRFPLGRADLGGARDLADPHVGATAARADIAELGRATARARTFVRVELVHVRHTLEGADTELALRRIAAVRELLSPDSDAWLLFEPRPIAPGAPLVAETGAVRLSLHVLGARFERGSVESGPGRE